VIIDPPPAIETPGMMWGNPSQMRDVTPAKVFVDQLAARTEQAAMPMLAPPIEPGPNAVLSMTAIRGEPVFYLFDPDTRMIFLAEHNGGVTKINGKTFEAPLPPGADADDLAETLWMRKVFPNLTSTKAAFPFPVISVHCPCCQEQRSDTS
jgi:hypothetical protein